MEKNNPEQNKADKPANDSNSSNQPTDNKMAQNPNPRANENIKNTPFEKEEGGAEVGSEITDGEAG